MKKDAIKWLLLGGALVFVLLYGMEMSTTGIERINGPMVTSVPFTVDRLPEEDAADEEYSIAFIEQQERRIAKLERELEELREAATYDRLPGIPRNTEQSGINKLSDSASDVLQSASSSGIRFVASLFEGLTK